MALRERWESVTLAAMYWSDLCLTLLFSLGVSPCGAIVWSEQTIPTQKWFSFTRSTILHSLLGGGQERWRGGVSCRCFQKDIDNGPQGITLLIFKLNPAHILLKTVVDRMETFQVGRASASTCSRATYHYFSAGTVRALVFDQSWHTGYWWDWCF